MPILKLQTSDEVIFDVDVEVAKCSKVIATMLETLGMDEDEKEVIPLPNVESSVFHKLIEWAAYHKENPTPEPCAGTSQQNEDDVCPWDKIFLEKNRGILLKLIEAANYLDIEKFLTLACMNVAKSIQGKPPEEIRRMFNVKNDFTRAEEEAVKEENRWCEED